MIVSRSWNTRLFLVLARNYSEGSQISSVKAAGPSAKVVTVPSQDVGPGASKEGKYKNPEYFCYSDMSYFNADIEMLKFRLPQPSPRDQK